MLEKGSVTLKLPVLRKSKQVKSAHPNTLFTFQTQMKYDQCQTLDRAISNIKYRLRKYYVRMGLTLPLPELRVCRDFSNTSLSLGTLT